MGHWPGWPRQSGNRSYGHHARTGVLGCELAGAEEAREVEALATSQNHRRRLSVSHKKKYGSFALRSKRRSVDLCADVGYFKRWIIRSIAELAEMRVCRFGGASHDRSIRCEIARDTSPRRNTICWSVAGALALARAIWRIFFFFFESARFCRAPVTTGGDFGALRRNDAGAGLAAINLLATSALTHALLREAPRHCRGCRLPVRVAPRWRRIAFSALANG